MIFTEYRDTLDASSPPCRLHRDASASSMAVCQPSKRAAVDAFNDGRIDVWLPPMRAGEGLNLHHRCRLVIDVELPWNPLRLEQRIGRVDRLGQQRTVHAIRLFHPGTIESAVLEHLRGRHHRADRDVAAAVFEGASADPDEPDIRSLVVAAAKDEARRFAQQRRLEQHNGPRSRIWTFRRGRRPTDLIALHRVTAVNDAGCVVSEWLQASRIQLAACPDNHRRWRQLIAGLNSIVTLTPPDLPPSRDSLERRISVIRSRVKRDRSSRYQRSLFDRRADADAASRQAVAERLDAALFRTLRSVTSPIAFEAMRVDLVAVWTELRR